MMQFKAVEVMPQITLRSLAWHAHTHTIPFDWLPKAQSAFHMYTKWQEGRGRTREEQKQKERWKKKVEERWLIRSRKCQPDGHMMELSSLTVLCRCPVKHRVWDILCHFTSNFPRIGGHEISEKAEGNPPDPRIFLLFSVFQSRTQILEQGDQLFSVFERVLFSRAARLGLIPAIPQLILVRI